MVEFTSKLTYYIYTACTSQDMLELSEHLTGAFVALQLPKHYCLILLHKFSSFLLIFWKFFKFFVQIFLIKGLFVFESAERLLLTAEKFENKNI